MPSRWEYIRRAASRARARFAKESNRAPADIDACVDVHILAEVVYGLSSDRDVLPHGVHAILDPDGELIRVRANAQPEEERFLIAHELGHAELEGLTTVIVDFDQHISSDVAGLFETSQGVLRGYSTRERREQEANLFALELLVSAQDLWEQLQHGHLTIEDLSARYRVSCDVVRSQIVNVGLYPPSAPSAEARKRKHERFTLNRRQREAITTPLPTLVIAGPGSGKTHCIVERYVALLRDGVDPQQILALTFSNKAAEELRGRILKALPAHLIGQVGNVQVYTFHAFGLELLRRYHQHVGLPASVLLLTPGDLFIVLKRRLDDLPLTLFRSLTNPAQHLADLLDAVEWAKHELVTPERYAELVEEDAVAEQGHIAELQAHRLKQVRDKAKGRQRRLEKLREMAAFYAAYQHILQTLQVVDYGDLEMLPTLLLQRDANIRAEVQREYHYVLVDEFQDINFANGELVLAIDGGRQQVWAVGDPCQSIYRFRGSSPVHLNTFTDHYPQATTVHLDRNYRSVPGIVLAGDAQITGAPAAATRPQMMADRRSRLDERAVIEIIAEHETGEAMTIADQITHAVERYRRQQERTSTKKLRRRRRRLPVPRRTYGDHVVLCRTRHQAAMITAFLRDRDIPAEYVGNLLDDPVCKDLLALCTLMRSGDRSGLLRVLTMPDHRLKQIDIDCLQPRGVVAVGGLRRVLTQIDAIPGLSDAGRATLDRLAAIVQDLNRHATPYHMLMAYLFTYSRDFQERLVRAAQGSQSAQRTVRHTMLLLLLARDLAKPSLVVEDTSPYGFVRYVRELVEAGQMDQWNDAGLTTDAVRVMTIHKSKGLEFPVVFVPYLAEGQFPRNESSNGAVPFFERVLHSGPIDGRVEERYLCYVAMTRARDQLILLHAQTYEGDDTPRSLLLPEPAPWPQQMVANYDVQERTLTWEGRLAPTVGPQPPVRDYAVRTFRTCPRRYLYQEVYGIHGPISPYVQMHGCIRSTAQQLAELVRTNGTIPDAAMIDTLLDAAWQERGPTNIPYATEYRNQARTWLLDMAHRLSNGTATIDAVDQDIIVSLDHGAVQIRIDRIEQRADGPVYVIVRTGQPKKEHQREERVILAAWHYQQQYAAEPRVELHYPSVPYIHKVKHQSGTIPRHIGEINEALRRMAAFDFPPQPDPWECATCPFNMICSV